MTSSNDGTSLQPHSLYGTIDCMTSSNKLLLIINCMTSSVSNDGTSLQPHALYGTIDGLYILILFYI